MAVAHLMPNEMVEKSRIAGKHLLNTGHSCTRRTALLWPAIVSRL